MKLSTTYSRFALVLVLGLVGLSPEIVGADAAQTPPRISSLGSLGAVRSALSIYYGDTQGQYPARLEQLVPKYLAQIPTVTPVAGGQPIHATSNKVKAFQDSRGDDTGGWGYVGDPGNSHWGMVFINCKHPDDMGNAWNSY